MSRCTNSITTGGGRTFTKITDNIYSHYPADWKLGRLKETIVTHKADGQPDQVRKSTFDYNAQGSLKNETVEPADDLWYNKRYVRNSYGATFRLEETWKASGSAMTDPNGSTVGYRDSTYSYDSKYRYRTSGDQPAGPHPDIDP